LEIEVFKVSEEIVPMIQDDRRLTDVVLDTKRQIQRAEKKYREAPDAEKVAADEAIDALETALDEVVEKREKIRERRSLTSKHLAELIEHYAKASSPEAASKLQRRVQRQQIELLDKPFN
jgi:hypothetical protein